MIIHHRIMDLNSDMEDNVEDRQEQEQIGKEEDLTDERDQDQMSPPLHAAEAKQAAPRADPSKEMRLDGVRNKIRRRELMVSIKREKKKEKRARQDARKKAAEALGDKAPPKQVPKTIDALREHDETTVRPESDVKDGQEDRDDVDEEVDWDIENDEFKDYFSGSYEPKVLITSADNPRSVSETKTWSRLLSSASVPAVPCGCTPPPSMATGARVCAPCRGRRTATWQGQCQSSGPSPCGP